MEAIRLRKLGLSYSEILTKVPVAKSSLGLWLKSVGLSKKIKYNLTEKKRLAGLRGAQKRHEQRISLTKKILYNAENEIKYISKRELWLIGVCLYWAEGSKEKERHPGSNVQFSNSDPKMILLFLKWLDETCKIPQNMIYFDIYIHESHRKRVDLVKEFWRNCTGYPKEQFDHVYYKKNKIRTKRINIGDSYYGVVKVRVRRSSAFLRRIAGWIEGVCDVTLPGGVFGNTPAFEAGDTRFEP